jgi:hypothetical protein
VSDNLLERFQSDRSEYFSPPICEILREYEAWRVEASNDLVGEMEKALEPFAAFIDAYERKPVKWDDEFISIHVGTEFEAGLRLSDLRKARATLSRMRDARKEGQAK